MHPRFRLLLAALALPAALGPLRADDQSDRVAASFLLAQGRPPSATEIASWSTAKGDVAALLARHRDELRASAEAAAVARAAAADAFGRPATETEVAAAGGALYHELLQRHVQALAADAAAYRQVQERAYRLLLARPAYPEEAEYWAKRPPLPFVLLVGCIENWARRNQPGLTVTSGTPSVSIGCHYLATARLSPAVAAEARQAIGLVPAGGPDLAAELGRHVVAPGAAELVSVGRIHFALAGNAAFLRPGAP